MHISQHAAVQATVFKQMLFFMILNAAASRAQQKYWLLSCFPFHRRQSWAVSLSYKKPDQLQTLTEVTAYGFMWLFPRRSRTTWDHASLSLKLAYGSGIWERFNEGVMYLILYFQPSFGCCLQCYRDCGCKGSAQGLSTSSYEHPLLPAVKSAEIGAECLGAWTLKGFYLS